MQSYLESYLSFDHATTPIKLGKGTGVRFSKPHLSLIASINEIDGLTEKIWDVSKIIVPSAQDNVASAGATIYVSTDNIITLIRCLPDIANRFCSISECSH